MEFCQLEGVALDEAVARAIGAEPGAAYSSDWSHGGPLIERYQIHLSGPDSSVHRNGGSNPGWGPSGMWTTTSWKLRDSEGRRGLGYHDTSQLVAAMRLIVLCHTQAERTEGGQG
jgi:hypothetical protein